MRSKAKKISKESQLPTRRLALQLPLLIASILVAIIIARSDFVSQIISGTSVGGYLIVSFIAGIFFSSFFGVAPATVAFVEMGSEVPSVFLMALMGGFGAMIGDLSIFQILRFGIIDDLIAYFQRHSHGAFLRLFRINIFKYLLMTMGAIFVATPIPDEIGLAMMGIAKLRWWVVALAGFTLNTVGIYLLGALARAAH